MSLISRAQYFFLHQNQPDKIHHLLKNHIFGNLFFENSTRTRSSFEVAAKKMGAEVINFQPDSSSVKKGESVYDTIKTFDSLGLKALIIRHGDDRLIDQLQKKMTTSLINAGAGVYEHPSQGLLDLLTLYQEFSDLKGLKVGICGDIKHSRVAGSLIIASKIIGFKVYIAGPAELLIDDPLVTKCDFGEMLKIVDAQMMLRVQFERHEELSFKQEEYHQKFGMNLERLENMKKHSILMHPGPFNRGIEVSDEVIEHEKSRIFKQVNNGVAARMAILEWISSGDRK